MILFSASYGRGVPSANLRAHSVCDWLCSKGIEAECMSPSDDIVQCRERVARLSPSDVLYIQKWAFDLHKPREIHRCKAKIVYDFDDLTSAKRHIDLLQACDAAVVGTKFLASQVVGKPYLVAPSPIRPEMYGDPKPFGDRRNGVVVAKYGLKPYLGKLAKLAPELNRILDKYEHQMWFFGASRPAQYDRLWELYPGCKVHPIVKNMESFYRTQVPIMKLARWGFVPYDKRCKGKSATSLLTLMACGIPSQAFAYGECEEVFGSRLRRWSVRHDDRFFENAERFMSDTAQCERFVKVSQERLRAYSLDTYCGKLADFIRGLGAEL